MINTSVIKPKSNKEVYINLLKQIPKQLRQKILECYGKVLYHVFGIFTIYLNAGIATTTRIESILINNDLVPVQPLQAPIATLYYLDFNYVR